MAEKKKSQKKNWSSFNNNTKQYYIPNYIKAKIDNTQKNNMYRLCRDRDSLVCSLEFYEGYLFGYVGPTLLLGILSAY